MLAGRRCAWGGVLAALALLYFEPHAARAAPRLELEAGPSWTFLLYDRQLELWDRNQSRISFAGGAHLEFLPTSRFGLATGLRFASFRNRVPISAYNYEFRITESYLTLPVRFVIRPTAGRGVYAALGPEAGWLASARIESQMDPVIGGFDEIQMARIFTQVPTTEFRDIRNSLEHWIVIGGAEAGTDFPLGRQRVRLGLRYTHAFTRTTRKGEWYSDWKTQSLDGIVGLVW